MDTETKTGENRPPPKNRWLALWTLGAGVLMGTLDISIVNVALPTLVIEMKTSLATVQWVIIIYGLLVTALMLVMGRLGDMLGKKKVFCYGLGVFILGSLICGLSPTIKILIAARAFQAFGAVMMQALVAAMITDLFPLGERGRALGAMGAVVSIGLALGPALGGVIIGQLSWHYIFFINVPVGLVTLAIIIHVIPPIPPSGEETRFDFIGAISLFTALVCFALGMTLVEKLGFGHEKVLFLFSGAVVGGVVFLLVELRSKHPMCEPALIKDGQVALGLVMSFMAFLLIGASYLLPFYLQYGRKFPVTMVGLLMMAIPVSMGVVAPLAGAWSDRWGAGPIRLIGLIILAGGCLAISTLTPNSGPLEYVLKACLCGLGMGLFQSPNISAVMSLAPSQHRGVASGLLSLTRSMGTSTGLPFMGMIFLTRLSALSGQGQLDKSAIAASSPENLTAALSLVYRVGAGIVLAAAILSIIAWFRLRRQNRGAEI